MADRRVHSRILTTRPIPGSDRRYSKEALDKVAAGLMDGTAHCHPFKRGMTAQVVQADDGEHELWVDGVLPEGVTR